MRTIFQVLLFFIFSFFITGCFNSDDGVVDRISSVSDENNTISISIPDFTNNGNSKFKIAGPFKMSIVFTPHGLTSQTTDILLSDLWDSTLSKYVHTITNVPTGIASVVLTILDYNGHTIYTYSTSEFDVKSGVINTLAVTLAPSAVPQVTKHEVHEYFPLVANYNYTYSEDSTYTNYDGSYNVIGTPEERLNESYTTKILENGIFNTCVYPSGISCFAFGSPAIDPDEEDYYKWSADNKSLYFYGNYDAYHDVRFFSNESGYGTYYDVSVIQKMSFDSGSPPVLNVADMILGNTSSTVTLIGTIVLNASGGTWDGNTATSDNPPNLSETNWPTQVFPIRAEQTWQLLDIVDTTAPITNKTDCLKMLVVTKVYDTAINKLIMESTKEMTLALNVGIVEQKQWCNDYFYENGTLMGIDRDEETSTLTSFSPSTHGTTLQVD